MFPKIQKLLVATQPLAHLFDSKSKKMPATISLLKTLRRNWTLLTKTRCSGTIAVVDLAFSTQFKVSYPPPEIWFERQYTFLDLVESTAKELFGRPFIKFTGDGALIFAKEKAVQPLKFVSFVEVLCKRISDINAKHYSSKELRIQFKCVLDYGSNIYVLPNGDPNGTVVDRAFRIIGHLPADTIAASSNFYNLAREHAMENKFVLAGKAYLRGVSEEWHLIYALNSIDGFSTELNIEQRNREALADIWEMGPGNRPIWVISGAIHQRLDTASSSYSMQHGDTNALIEIVQTLSKVYPDRSIHVVNSEEYLRRNGPSLGNDLVSIGGPDFNKVSEKVLAKAPLRFRGKRNSKYDDSTLTMPDDKFDTGRDENGIITSDPAVFLKMNGTFLEDRFLYVVMGNQTQGTYAAASLFGISSPHLLVNREFLREKGLLKGKKQFAIVAMAETVQDYVEPICLPTAKHVRLVRM